MRPPKTIKAGHLNFSVLVDTPLLIKQSADDEKSYLGRTWPTRGLVVLKDTDDVSVETQMEVMLHEVIHIAAYQSGLDHFVDDDVEENVASFLAGPLLDILRRNPQLVKYLCQP